VRLLTVLASRYPGRTTAAVVALLLAGIAEGLGLSALFPLLRVAGNLGDRLAEEPSGPGRALMRLFDAAGVAPTLHALLAVIVAAAAVKSGLALLANRQVGYIVAGVATDLRLKLIRALLAARWPYYVGQPLGALANAVATETTRAATAYLHGTTVIAFLIQAAVYAVLALLVSWKAALGALVAGLGVLLLVSRLVRAARRAGARQTRLLRSLVARLADLLQSVKPLKSMGRESVAGRLLLSDTLGLNDALCREVFSREALRSFQELAITTVVAAGVYIAVTRAELPFASVLVLTFIIARALVGLGKVQRGYQQMLTCESAFWSLERAVGEAAQQQEISLGTRQPFLLREIRLDGITFAHEGQPVLRDVSLTIPAGQVTVVVGPSGVGKTTAVDLVTGLLRPHQGEVWIDELPMADVDRAAWRRMIGYVPQETLLLHDSVLRNVTLGDPALTPADAERALRAAGAWDFVTALPEGVLSLVGERGGRLSGGQRQRLAIARALIHRPALLILDEATSALDADSEAEICASLRRLSGQLTILAVSHRPALAEAADRVYRLDVGSAVLVEDRAMTLASSVVEAPATLGAAPPSR
jgi:ATP-binding cassette, subfamily C, bacterial